MQLVSYLSAAAAIVSIASAERSAVALNKEKDNGQGCARIHNRCDYDVYLWSVLKGTGCPDSGMVTLKKGESYSENYAKASQWGAQGVSIKVSKTQQCKGSEITQLEYFVDDRDTTDSKFRFNYLDVSYVDCDKDCPTRKEGYYLVAGKQSGDFKASAANTWCPVLSCHDAASCSKMSYVLPDDVQTKSCGLTQDMDFYMCGSQAPSDDDNKPAPSPSPSSSSSKKVETPKPATTLSKASSSSAANYKVNAAAVTNAPEIKEQLKTPKVKTQLVYVTKYEYVNAKRHDHAHAHARRHQILHA